MNSIDPRVKRLPDINVSDSNVLQSPDQFGTFEVFVQPKAGKPFQHEGAIHAPNLEMAYILAKETLTRRFTCTSLSVVETKNVYVSPITEGKQNVYDLITMDEAIDGSGPKTPFEIYHLTKRGKQHVHIGGVNAHSPKDALSEARKHFNKGIVVFNIWAIRASDIRTTSPDEQELWTTLPEKKFRDAADYKGGDKLKEFLNRSKSQ